jgi:hypothetical protein
VHFPYLSSFGISLNINAIGDIYEVLNLDLTMELKRRSVIGVSPMIHQEVPLKCALKGSNSFLQVKLS